MSLACAQGRDAYYVALSTLKTVRLKDGKLAAIIGYQADVVNWKSARWSRLSRRERLFMPKPHAPLMLYGAQGSFVVVYSPSGIRMHECGMIVS
ncbi:MAG: hypothetical protein JRH20_23500 [Deltaproteobacteria bacterium]|nr:hypothetical protein [Deltaproteobacteria bacterium]